MEFPLNPVEMTEQEIFDVTWHWMFRPEAQQSSIRQLGYKHESCLYRRKLDDESWNGCALCMFVPNDLESANGCDIVAALSESEVWVSDEKEAFMDRLQDIHDIYWDDRIEMMRLLANEYELEIPTTVHMNVVYAIQEYINKNNYEF